MKLNKQEKTQLQEYKIDNDKPQESKLQTAKLSEVQFSEQKLTEGQKQEKEAFLKRVEIFGFKSFADRVEIDFQKGISAIVGPNGCGKSNIVDSIKWVIGEQSSKILRAGKMEDVIFNGSEDRRPMNIAEVCLTISNCNGILSMDIPEISIKRRLYRSGESEYFINKKIVRLKEVRELFFDTGIGKSAYSVMEQGKIDQILSNKPEERRYIFEEAAGITKYKIRSHEAENKLEKTKENMRQVQGIIGEVKKNYDNLKKQTEKTKLYRSLKETIFEYEKDIQLLNLKDFIKKKEKKEDYFKSRTEVKNKIQSQIEAINESMEKNIDLVNSMESQLIEKQKELYKIDIEKNNKNSQIKILKERNVELQKKIHDHELLIESSKEKILNLEIENKQNMDSLKEILAAESEVLKNIQGFKKDLEIFSKKIVINDKEILENESEIENKDKSIQNLRLELRSVTDDIVTQMDQNLKEIGYSYNERLKKESKISEYLKSLRIQLEGKSTLLKDILMVGENNKSDINKYIKSIQTQIINSLENVEKLMELFDLYSKSIPSFLDEFLSPEGIITKKRDIDSKINDNYQNIVNRKKINENLKNENKSLDKKVNEYRKTLENLRVNHAKMETRKISLVDIIKRIEKEIKEQKLFLDRNNFKITESKSKINGFTSEIEKLNIEVNVLKEKEKKHKKKLSGLESNISGKNKSLIVKEKSLKEKMDNLLKSQKFVENIHVELAEIKTDIKNIYNNFMEKHSRDLSEFESRMFEIELPLNEIRVKYSDCRKKIKNMGHVNLMAIEEFEEVKERYNFLTGQIEDLKKAKENLIKITEEIQNESTELFLKNYNKIKKNFHIIFRRLFGGGRGELKLTDPSNILESGIDIYAQPPGKKLESISLLSGGERSLIGVALLFAVYMVKPSPFCILDEIDAALDDANIGRFLNLLLEFANTSQFIIISHNKRTLANANTLLGITMEETGVSKIIIVKLKDRK